MKKAFVILAILAVFVGLSYYFIKNKIGNVMPAVLPPAQNIISRVNENISEKTGQKVELPLNISTGFSIGLFAKDLNGARAMAFTPEGTLLVSLTSSGKIAALADSQNLGSADKIKIVKEGLRNPHGMAFHEGKLYVAEETSVTVYDWDSQNWQLSNEKILFSLPLGGRHFTRSIVFDKSGKLYISVGSTCDTCIEKNPTNGTVLISDPAGNSPRIFAKGLRNSVFITLNNKTNEIWAADMGRDFLGDDLPPDEINIIRDGGDYGWPYCFGDKVYDKNFGQKDASYCENTISPIYNIPAHSAPLGLTFIDSKQFPTDWQGDLLVVYHGSWNRSIPSGYKVVHMKVKGNEILGEEDFLTGFLVGNQAVARPVDLVFDKAGSLYISDDKAGYIFKVVKSN